MRLFQVFSKPVKKVSEKSVQVGPPILCFFSNLESPMYLCVCIKLWYRYGIRSISNSRSASSQLTGEFMLLHAIYKLAIWLWKRQCLPSHEPQHTSL